MFRITLISLALVLFSFRTHNTGANYMFIMLKSIPACNGKCNNYEITEYPKSNAEDCKKQEDTCKAKYGTTASYYTVAPGEAVIYYKYNKFVTECDCKILGVRKSSSVAKARIEMDSIVAAEKIKKPKAYHNYEVYNWWPR